MLSYVCRVFPPQGLPLGQACRSRALEQDSRSSADSPRCVYPAHKDAHGSSSTCPRSSRLERKFTFAPCDSEIEPDSFSWYYRKGKPNGNQSVPVDTCTSPAFCCLSLDEFLSALARFPCRSFSLQGRTDQKVKFSTPTAKRKSAGSPWPLAEFLKRG